MDNQEKEAEIHGAVRAPAPPLDRYIEVLWYQNIPIASAREIILPSPYIELILNFGKAHKVFDGPELASFQWQSKHWLAGMQSRYITIESQTSHMIGARLKPGGAAAFFKETISAFTDRVTPLDAVMGVEADRWRERLLDEEEDETRFDVFEGFLRERLDEERPGLDLALEAVGRINAAQGNLNLGDLSEGLGVSHKHLIEQFTALVGLRPKQYARVVRFASVLPALVADTAPDWAALAQMAGYHDQSHFNREFQLFAGLTPGQYLKMRAAYQEDYSEGDDTRFVPLG